jgi:hypothetical protein
MRLKKSTRLETTDRENPSRGVIMIFVSKLERADLACLCRLSHQTAWILIHEQLMHYTHTVCSFFVAEQKDLCARRF